MPKSHGRRKKTRTHVPEGSIGVQTAEGIQSTKNNVLLDNGGAVVPRALVIKKSKLSPSAASLLIELRKLLSPNTSMKLKERKYNKLKDFASVCTPLHITHLLILNQIFNPKKGKVAGALTIRIARYPTGPTLTFKIIEATMSRSIKRQQKRTYDSPSLYLTAPMVVLNNFNNHSNSSSSNNNQNQGVVAHHVRLMKATFQNMFPALNVHALKLSDCRRVVLFNYDPQTDTVSMRHYAIKAIPISLTRNVRKLVSLKRSKKIPNLGKLTDISEYLSKSLYRRHEQQQQHNLNEMMIGEDDTNSIGTNNTSYGSDSEIEDETCHVTLPEKYKGTGNVKSAKSSIKLIEIGPRLTLKLIRVQKEFLDGTILYEGKEKLKSNVNQEMKEKGSRLSDGMEIVGEENESDYDEEEDDARDFDFTNMNDGNSEDDDDTDSDNSEAEEELEEYEDEDEGEI